MNDKISNLVFPISGGAIGGTTPLWIGWHTLGDMVIAAAVMAFVGGVIGFLVKLGLDKIKEKLF